MSDAGYAKRTGVECLAVWSGSSIRAPLLGAYRFGQRKENPNDPPSHAPSNGAVAIAVRVEGMP